MTELYQTAAKYTNNINKSDNYQKMTNTAVWEMGVRHTHKLRSTDILTSKFGSHRSQTCSFSHYDFTAKHPFYCSSIDVILPLNLCLSLGPSACDYDSTAKHPLCCSSFGRSLALITGL